MREGQYEPEIVGRQTEGSTRVVVLLFSSSE